MGLNAAARGTALRRRPHDGRPTQRGSTHFHFYTVEIAGVQGRDRMPVALGDPGNLGIREAHRLSASSSTCADLRAGPSRLRIEGKQPPDKCIDDSIEDASKACTFSARRQNRNAVGDFVHGDDREKQARGRLPVKPADHALVRPDSHRLGDHVGVEKNHDRSSKS